MINAKIRIIIADDHMIMREGLRSLIKSQNDMEVVAEAEDGKKALELTRELIPDIVLMDITMPGLNGIEATRQIAGSLTTRVIALSMHSDRHFISGMLGAGASGYLLKECAFEEVLKAIRAVVGNKKYLSSTIADQVIQDYFHQVQPVTSVYTTLTAREREILQNLAEGKSVKEIATQLFLSAKTVEVHRQQIMKKLNKHSIAELTKYAIQEGLISI
jgi:two-component system, NarL family, response regulator NreC